MWIILKKELRDARRNKWFLLLGLIFAGLAFALSVLGVAGLGVIGVSGFGRTTASLLNLVLLVVPLMALLLGGISLTHEIEQKTLQTLMAQPVTPSEIFFGKFLGTAIALAVTIIGGFGLSGCVIGLYGSWTHLGPYLGLVGLTVVLGWVFLGIGFVISSCSQKVSTAIGVAIFVWVLFLFGSDLGMMGASVAFKLSSQQVLTLVLANPVQVFKMLVLGLLEGDLDRLGATGKYALDLFGGQFFIFLSALLGAWCLVPLLGALVGFCKKCRP